MPFQAYRLRLVEMLDDLLGWLENDAFPLFVLDGQTVLLEDVFAVRPDYRERISDLVKKGKVKLGPWYTMPDLFLARPESLIRNLQRGVQMAEELGGASRVGYVPDSFGHFAQLPQVLRGFNIQSFLFMRGMPESLRDTKGALFTWRAPDGSDVLATYLREGYFPLGALGQESFHGRYDGLPADMAAAQKRLDETLARLTPVQNNSVFVLPAGGDHLPARADLKNVVSELNKSQNDVELRFGSFEEYLAALQEELTNNESLAANLSVNGSISKAIENKLPVYEGDLLGQADHPLLRNVLSSRIDLKILNHQAQSFLVGIVEPILAWSRVRGLPVVHESLLQTAWDALLKNHAHDDICGCSVDDVHFDNVQRYREIFALGQEIVTRQLETAVQKIWGPVAHSRSARVIVFNPHPWAQVAKVHARILMPDDGGEFSPESAARVLKAHDSAGNAVSVKVIDTLCKDIRNNYLETTWGRSYQVAFEASLPALGFEIFTFEESNVELQIKAEEKATSGRSENIPASLLSAFELQLEADLGDGYSFGPCPEIPMQKALLQAAWRDALDSKVIHLRYEIEGHAFIRRDALKNTPLQACLGPVQKMTIDVKARELGVGHANEHQPHEEHSHWELALRYKNIFADSRLRIVFWKLAGLEAVISDSQALWQHHSPAVPPCEIWPGPLAEPRYPGEKPYPVHHNNDGVVCTGSFGTRYFGGVGAHEFEIIKSSNHSAVAFTLHRAVGYLSVRGGRIRSCQAGPQRATPDAQLQIELNHKFAFGSDANLSVAEAFRCLKNVLQPVWVQELPVLPSNCISTAGTSETLCDVAATPLQLMSCRPAPGSEGIILRLLNPTENKVEVAILLEKRMTTAQQLQLDDSTDVGCPTERIENGQLQTTFKPFEIKTWKILPC